MGSGIVGTGSEQLVNSLSVSLYMSVAHSFPPEGQLSTSCLGSENLWTFRILSCYTTVVSKYTTMHFVTKIKLCVVLV